MPTPPSTPSPDRLASLLDKTDEARVLVVGDCMLDHYVAGNVDRISPEAPVPVLHVEEERKALGGAANVAAGVVSLGGACRLVGVVGADEAGRDLRRLLQACGIDDGDLLDDADRPTTIKTRLVARHQQMLRVDRESVAGLPDEKRRALTERAGSALGWANVLVLQDYDKGVQHPELAEHLLSLAEEESVPTVVDPKLRHFFDYAGATVFKPNARELAAALGTEAAPADEATLSDLCQRLGCAHLLVTRGEEGMLLFSRAGELVRIPSRARDVFDVTGAGDTVVAVVAVCLAAGATVLEASTLANVAAGIQVSRSGAVAISRVELAEALDRALRESWVQEEVEL